MKPTVKKPCTNCYGKGYSTILNMLYGAADFIGDRPFSYNQVSIVPCGKCQKWTRSKKVRDRANEEAKKLMSNLHA